MGIFSHTLNKKEVYKRYSTKKNIKARRENIKTTMWEEWELYRLSQLCVFELDEILRDAHSKCLQM